jgi:nitrite reductase/ring-hydroxylating ferredoxin subunit
MDNLERIFLCASDEVVERGRGVRFAVLAGGRPTTGFVVRFKGTAFAYLNRCAHVPIELDWNQGEFFESSGLYLMCATHGAIYAPETGRCQGGPCRGNKLRSIAVTEITQQLYWQPDAFVMPVPSDIILNKENSSDEH